MWWGCVQAIADVHALDWRSLRLDKLLMPTAGGAPAGTGRRVLRRGADLGVPGQQAPRARDAVKWLRDNIYEPEHLRLCWGDSRLSNILYGQEFEVTAVLDWEVAYIGDHEADLAWLLFVDWALPGVWRACPAGRDAEPGRDHRSLARNCRAARCATCATTKCSRPSRRHPGLAAGNQAPRRGTAHRGFDLAGFCVERIRRLLG